MHVLVQIVWEILDVLKDCYVCLLGIYIFQDNFMNFVKICTIWFYNIYGVVGPVANLLNTQNCSKHLGALMNVLIECLLISLAIWSWFGGVIGSAHSRQWR